MSETSNTSAINDSTEATRFFQHWRWLGLGVLVLILDRVTKYVVVSEMAYGDRIQILPFFARFGWPVLVLGRQILQNRYIFKISFQTYLLGML